MGSSVARVGVAIAFLCLIAPTDTVAKPLGDTLCCVVARVNQATGDVWLRHPGNGVLFQLNTGVEDAALFKAGDRFDPSTGVLNGTRLEKSYPVSQPNLPEPNASVVRARGAEVVIKHDETGKLHRFYALHFGPVLSSLKPKTRLILDLESRLAIFEFKGQGEGKNVRAQIFSFQLE